MKRVLSVMVVAALLLLPVGCKQEETPAVEPVTTGFSCEVSADYRGMAIKGTLTREASGELRVSLTEPATLSGMAVRWDGEKMTMELGGMQIPVDAAKVPQGALVKSVLSALAAVPVQGELTDDGYVVGGEVDGKEYTVVCAPDTGLVRSLSVPQDELTVAFQNVVLLN